MDFDHLIEKLTPIALRLKGTKDLGEKQEILISYPRLKKALSEGLLKSFLPNDSDLSSKIALFSLFVIEQEHLLAYNGCKPPKERIRLFLSQLVSIDHFYEGIGGIVGYHLKVLELLAKKQHVRKKALYNRAPGIDLSKQSTDVDAAVAAGIRALPEMGEIYPIGGLGSRLNLLSKSGEPLPAASLPFTGRTLLEGLIRDIQAREFLYYRLFHKQITVPIALMTSLEKHNNKYIEAICEKNHWFGRPKESFFLFSQLSVPVVSLDGKWVLKGPLEPLLQPGGHGALWRTAEERGVFFWFQKQEKHRLLIRQINNPIAGLDHGLLALIGLGKQEHKSLGFASCERLPHAAEGVLVLKEEDGNVHLSNIEYTDFKHYGIEDCPTRPYPANTNILYVDIKKLQPVIKKNPLPGLILNMKSKVRSFEGKEIYAGRLESMMQNISDALSVEKNESLPTFLTYNERKRTISTTKRSFDEKDRLLETPEGAFYDLLYNAHTLLKDVCGIELSDFCTPEDYIKHGPSHLFLYHPALGPLYQLIRQKIQKGKIAEGSELQLEIADLYLDNLGLEGSLLIQAKQVMGHFSQGINRYSHKTGKCVLKRVKVRNKGIQKVASNCYWKNQIKRQQALSIILEGHSEFYAEDVAFEGNQTIIVPDNERWIAEPDGVHFRREKADWKWNFQMKRDQVFLNQN